MIFFDLETQNLAHEVGGWRNLPLLRVAVAVTYDDDSGFQTWWEGSAADLVAELRRSEVIIGFNVNRFDYGVLSLYGETEDLPARTFDLHQEIWEQVHRRIGLEQLSMVNLGESKSHSGIDAVALFRAGKLEELEAKCQQDVELTKRVFEFWEANGLLWINDTQFVVWPGLGGLEEGVEDDD